jgi:ribosomal protein S18 acetylase RimI-like enzyme
MITIRRMGEEDADAVREVDAVAFWTWETQVKGQAAQLVRRTRTNVLACREKDPAGCFVATDDTQVVGFIFSRTWGGAGWFGTFAVLPEYQGRGIGQRLIAASLEYLRQAPERVIGLETMPGSPSNLGLYLRQGFQARFPTLLLHKALEQPPGDGPDLPAWSSADPKTRERWLADLQDATGQILPGLDYTKEIAAHARHGVGQTLVLTDSHKAIGMSIVGLVSDCENWGAARANVQALALHPAHTDDQAFHALLDATEVLAHAHGKQMVALAVNARHTWALERLLRWGYRVERMAVHMVLPGTDGGPVIDEWVDLSRWAG